LAATSVFMFLVAQHFEAFRIRETIQKEFLFLLPPFLWQILSGFQVCNWSIHAVQIHVVVV